MKDLRRPRPKFCECRRVVYRATSYDVPLLVSPNRRSGRWNIAGEQCVQYLCLDAEAPFAEIVRHEDLRTAEAMSHYRTTVWQLHVEEGAVVDYSSFDLAEAAGFEPRALVEDDHERCQAEARRLIAAGARAILSPSAALPGSTSLTLFGPRVCVPWNAKTALASSVRAQPLATGHPPSDLIERVRYFGQPHPLLREHLKARGGG